MANIDVKFGTSGVRGLVVDLTDKVCYAYTAAFLSHMQQSGDCQPGGEVGIAGDMRASTTRIMEACAQSVITAGLKPIYCGLIPTPALANWGLLHHVPTIMVTGSHIPDDRNGIKFYKSSGEILKDDELAILAQPITWPVGLFTADGMLMTTGRATALPPMDATATVLYRQRYLEFFPPNCLSGISVGLYQHSSVASEAIYEVLTALGATVSSSDKSTAFQPVDTEAVRAEDREFAWNWAKTQNFTSIVSTDGDGDRPLVTDEYGNWLRGDTIGMLTAHHLEADVVITPITSNTALERSGWFKHVQRTRIGSPFVIAAMYQALVAGFGRVVGYEANGGFLLGSAVTTAEGTLTALPTRDAMIAIISILLQAKQRDCAISHLLAELPKRYSASICLKDIPTISSQRHLDAIKTDPQLWHSAFASHFGDIESFNNILPAGNDSTASTLFAGNTPTTPIDGLRILLKNQEILHLRPSGNAPELRIYAEAASQERADVMTRECLRLVASWRSDYHTILGVTH